MEDLDLLEALGGGSPAGGLHGVVVPAEVIEPGRWDPRGLLTGSGRRLLLLEGLVMRSVRVGGRSFAELLGPEDVITQGELAHGEPPLNQELDFHVLQTARVAVLGGEFVQRWPAAAERLVQRAGRRVARLAVQAATMRITRTDARLIVALWTLGARFGHVGPDGVSLRLGLTHENLGKLIGAHRASVTVALGSLSDKGLLMRRHDGTLVLVGSPEAAIAACRSDNTSRSGGRSAE